MKLRNKKTGEIIETQEIYENVVGEIRIRKKAEEIDSYEYTYNSLAELNKEWEDAEELKAPMHITGPVEKDDNTVLIEFCTHEEAEKATKRLRAWKRLKNHNLRVERGQRIFVNADNKLTSQKPLFVMDTYEEVEDDLDLLFGGEE